MKYVKAEAPFALEDGKKTLIQVFHQEAGQVMRDSEYIKAAMVAPTSGDKMVLLADAKCLLPYPSRGAILTRSHSANLAGLEELHIHPEIFDQLVERGILTVDGVAAKVVEKQERRAAEKTEAAPVIEAAPDDKGSDFDVDKDGDVDATDVKMVAEAAADEESLEEADGKDSGEDSNAASPTDN
jgi:hypothetical protein